MARLNKYRSRFVKAMSDGSRRDMRCAAIAVAKRAPKTSVERALASLALRWVESPEYSSQYTETLQAQMESLRRAFDAVQQEPATPDDEFAGLRKAEREMEIRQRIQALQYEWTRHMSLA